jgi:uncharacterized delta-60 repeat protein
MAGKSVARRPFGSLDAVAVQGDGRIILLGASFSDEESLARYLADGRLDRRFGSGGTVTTGLGVGGLVFAVLAQPDGKIVTAGYGYPSLSAEDTEFRLGRYLPDGRPDGSFGRRGEVLTRFPVDAHTSTDAYAIAIQDDGKIVVGGGAERLVGKSYDLDFALARYETDGRLDRSFGSDGRVLTDVAGDGWANFVAIQEDGKIVAAGDALVRYTTDGRLDRTFGVVAKR